jgi:hypothetical protein
MIEIIESRGWRGERYALRCMSCGAGESVSVLPTTPAGKGE